LAGINLRYALVGINPKGRTLGVVWVQNKLARAADPRSATPSQLGSAGPTGGLPSHAWWKLLGRYTGHVQGRETKLGWADGDVLTQGHFFKVKPFSIFHTISQFANYFEFNSNLNFERFKQNKIRALINTKEKVCISMNATTIIIYLFK
jgi:hypothetical protein